MKDRYLRNSPALTEAECQLLQHKRVLIVGCGGLGGNLISIFSRVGIGHLRIVDGDVFEATNLNRQLFSEVPVLGHNKARVAADRVVRINPEIEIDAVETFLTEENASALLRDCDMWMRWITFPAAEFWPLLAKKQISRWYMVRFPVGSHRRLFPYPATNWWKTFIRKILWYGIKVFSALHRLCAPPYRRRCVSNIWLAARSKPARFTISIY